MEVCGAVWRWCKGVWRWCSGVWRCVVGCGGVWWCVEACGGGVFRGGVEGVKKLGKRIH